MIAYVGLSPIAAAIVVRLPRRAVLIWADLAERRRRVLLGQIGVDCRVLVSAADETALADEAPEDYVRRVAGDKADDVWARVVDDEPAPVLAADTAVVVDGSILGKPEDERDALAMLERLSAREHQVMTAVALRWQDCNERAIVVSEVRFRATTAAERAAYCHTGEPFDKAGGYAIQGQGAVFVEHISGSYSGVMGLPLCETAAILQRLGLPSWLEGTAGAS